MGQTMPIKYNQYNYEDEPKDKRNTKMQMKENHIPLSTNSYKHNNNDYNSNFNSEISHLQEENLNLKRLLEKEKLKNYHLEQDSKKASSNMISMQDLENLKEYLYL